MANYEQNIVDAIDILVDKAISNAGFNRTIQASIINSPNPDTGEYLVQYQDSTFTAYAVNPATVYEKGTMVYILIPNNDLTSTTKTILGPVKRNDKAYTSQNDTKYEVIGSNLITTSPSVSFSSYYNFSDDTARNLTNAGLILDNESFLNNIKTSNILKLSYNVRTTIPTVQQEFGEYGVILTLKYTNDNKISYIFSSSYFNGNPYTMDNEMVQYTLIKDIVTTDIEGIDSIIYFCKDFYYQIENEENAVSDIFLSNFKLEVVEEIQEEVFEDYHIVLSTPGGNSIKAIGEPQVSIIAQLKKQDTVVPQTNCQVFWFREDASIVQSSEHYNAYGGYGWYCLNKIYYTDSEKTDKRWLNGDNKYTVYQDDLLCESNKFKCVIAFENNTYEQEIILYNEMPSASINLTSSNGNYFLNGAENTDIVITINDVNANDDYTIDEDEQNYTYYWLERNSKGIVDNRTFTLTNTEDEDGVEYNYITVETDDIDSYSTFICTVYGSIKKWNSLTDLWDSIDNTFIGTKTITVFSSANLIVGANGLSIVNGEQTFKYNATGVSPCSDKNYNKSSILPLSIKLYVQEEDKLLSGEDILNNGGKINWLIPSENTLLVPIEDTEIDLYNDSSTMYYNRINDYELEFGILDNYNYSYVNNNIKVIVTYKDKYYNATTSFTFIKDGSDNINGNEYNVILSPLHTNLSTANKDYVIYVTNSDEATAYTGDETLLDTIKQDIKDLLDNINTNSDEYGSYSLLEKTQLFSYIKNAYIGDLSDIDVVDCLKQVKVDEEGNEVLDDNDEAVLIDYVFNDDGIDSKNIEEINSIILEAIAAININAKQLIQNRIAASNNTYLFDSNFGATMNGRFLLDSDVTEDILDSVLNEEGDETDENAVEKDTEDDLEETVIITNNIITDISEYANWFECQVWKDGTEKISSDNWTVSWSTLGEESALKVSNDGNYFQMSSFDTMIDLTETELITNDEFNADDVEGALETSGYEFNPILSDSFTPITNIINAEVTLADNNLKIYGHKPIITSYVYDNNFKINVEEESGFRFVQYSIDSITPQYDSSTPFNILLTNADGDKDISAYIKNCLGIESLENTNENSVDFNEDDFNIDEDSEEFSDEDEASVNNDYIITYKFMTIGGNLSIDADNTEDNICTLIPAKNFSGDVTSNALICFIYATDLECTQIVKIGWIHIPIYMYLDRYGLAFLNGWDGNKVEIEDGYICAPVMGAGQKEIDNSFTGVVLGTIVPKDDSEDNVNKVGLMGMSWGNQSFFLNAKDGSAMFGPDKDNGIFINPGYTYNGNTITRGESYISGNFEAGEGGDKNNLLGHLHQHYKINGQTNEEGYVSYLKLNNDSDYFAKNGLKIAFYPNPYIVSPSFVLDSDGDVFLKGTINATSGWLGSDEQGFQITENSLSAGSFETSSLTNYYIAINNEDATTYVLQEYPDNFENYFGNIVYVECYNNDKTDIFYSFSIGKDKAALIGNSGELGENKYELTFNTDTDTEVYSLFNAARPEEIVSDPDNSITDYIYLKCYFDSSVDTSTKITNPLIEFKCDTENSIGSIYSTEYYVNNHYSPIGTQVQGIVLMRSVLPNTTNSVASIRLTSGSWIVYYSVALAYSSTKTGTGVARYMKLDNNMYNKIDDNDSYSWDTNATIDVSYSDKSSWCKPTCRVIKIDEATPELVLRLAFKWSGGSGSTANEAKVARTITPQIWAIRIA